MKRKTNIIILVLLIGFLLTPFPAFAEEDYLTSQEREYATNYPVIDIGYSVGIAPFFFTDEKDEAQGIAKEILDTVSLSSGLKFSCKEYANLSYEVKNNPQFGIFAASEYYLEGLTYSDPLLTADAVLCVRNDIDILDLSHNKRAVINTGTMPEGIDTNLLYLCYSREDTFDALENGHADYTYANEYSVFYYNLVKNYKNFYSIPQK